MTFLDIFKHHSSKSTSQSRTQASKPKMSHATATLNGKVIAEADSYQTVEGNIYFPADSIDQSVLSKTQTTSVCPWKGTASYYTLNVDGKEFKDAAWSYETPKDKAQHIKDHVAFYKNKVDIKAS